MFTVIIKAELVPDMKGTRIASSLIIPHLIELSLSVIGDYRIKIVMYACTQSNLIRLDRKSVV